MGQEREEASLSSNRRGRRKEDTEGGIVGKKGITKRAQESGEGHREKGTNKQGVEM